MIAAIGVIEQRGKILVGLRNSPRDPQAHKLWQCAGGKVEFGESPEAAVVREINEETGLRVKVVSMIPKIIDVRWTYPARKVQVLLPAYVCKIIGGKLLKNPPEDFEFRWITKSEFPKLKCTPGTKQALRWWFYER